VSVRFSSARREDANLARSSRFALPMRVFRRAPYILLSSSDFEHTLWLVDFEAFTASANLI
jgi:hypothetical protein